MPDQVRVIEEKTQKYLVWIGGIFFTCLAGAFWFGYTLQTLQSRVYASELAIKDINEELRVRVGIRAEIMAAISALKMDVSFIKGQNEMIIRKMK